MSNEISKTNQNSVLAILQSQLNNFLPEAEKGTYNAEIRRNQPTAILILLDQSGSMSGEKAQFCSNILNNTLNEIINLSIREDGVRDYIDVGIIAYGASNQSEFLLKEGFMSLSELDTKVIRTEQQIHKKIIKGVEKEESKTIKIWLEAKKKGLKK